MIISILNCDRNFGIGKKNGLLFTLPIDMKFFKDTTLNHVVCMGENTLLSFPGSNPLPKRINVVLSSDRKHNYEGVINVHSFKKFLKVIKKYSKKEDVFIIGGASIYNQTLEYVDKVYLTKVDADGEAEVFFNNLDKNSNFKLVEESKPILDGKYPIKFLTYINLDKKKI